MSNLTGVTKFFPTANEGFVTALGSTIASGATTVPLQSVTGLTDGSVFVGIIEPGATNQQVFTGTVSVSGSSITNVVWTRGTNVGHTGGVTIVDYVTGTDLNMMSKGVQVEHNQDGTHSTALVSTLKTTILNVVYPIGSIYSNATSATNPGTLLGFGTWVAFGAGRTLVGVGTSDQAFAAGATGGESNHTLSVTEMPSHSHYIGGSSSYVTGSPFAEAANSGNANTFPSQPAGGGAAHNNLQPYIVVYLWERTA